MAEKSFKRIYKRRKRKKLRRLALLTGLLGLGTLGLYALVSSGYECGCTADKEALDATPAPSACTDEVTGTWVGEQRLNGYTYRFTAEIERATWSADSNQLVGTITSDYWMDREGTSSIHTPPTCTDTAERMVIAMPATGSIEGNQITFKGQSWSLSQEVCGSFDGGYFPDGFTGTLDTNEGISSINNDGFNTPTHVNFERVRCQDGTPTASAL
ncbi:MAG: hypothetical protein AAFX99_10360 [Myxococcota bacterium]